MIEYPLAFISGLITGGLLEKPVSCILKKKNEEYAKNRQNTKLKIILMALINGTGWFAAVYFLGFNLMALQGALVVSACLALSVTDIEIRIIPNEIVVFLFALTLIYIILDFPNNLLSHFWGFVIGFLLFIIPFIFGQKAGGGDLKLAAVMGLTLGFPNILTAILIMSVLLVIWLLGLLVTKKGGLKTKIAMAPFISLGFVITLMIPNKII